MVTIFKLPGSEEELKIINYSFIINSFKIPQLRRRAEGCPGDLGHGAVCRALPAPHQLFRHHDGQENLLLLPPLHPSLPL